jgi:hypothetical protein
MYFAACYAIMLALLLVGIPLARKENRRMENLQKFGHECDHSLFWEALIIMLDEDVTTAVGFLFLAAPASLPIIGVVFSSFVCGSLIFGRNPFWRYERLRSDQRQYHPLEAE